MAMGHVIQTLFHLFPIKSRSTIPSEQTSTIRLGKMFGSRRHRLHAHPTPPELKRKIEKSIVREEKDEERNLKHVVKEMEETERAVHKAQKVYMEPTLV